MVTAFRGVAEVYTRSPGPHALSSDQVRLLLYGIHIRGQMASVAHLQNLRLTFLMDFSSRSCTRPSGTRCQEMKDGSGMTRCNRSCQKPALQAGKRLVIVANNCALRSCGVPAPLRGYICQRLRLHTTHTHTHNAMQQYTAT